MSFFKKNMPSEEYERLVKRISEVEASLNTTKSRLDGLEIENKALRDKVLRKIQIGKDNPFTEKEQNLNTPWSPFHL